MPSHLDGLIAVVSRHKRGLFCAPHAVTTITLLSAFPLEDGYGGYCLLGLLVAAPLPMALLSWESFSTLLHVLLVLVSSGSAALENSVPWQWQIASVIVGAVGWVAGCVAAFAAAWQQPNNPPSRFLLVQALVGLAGLIGPCQAAAIFAGSLAWKELKGPTSTVFAVGWGLVAIESTASLLAYLQHPCRGSAAAAASLEPGSGPPRGAERAAAGAERAPRGMGPAFLCAVNFFCGIGSVFFQGLAWSSSGPASKALDVLWVTLNVHAALWTFVLALFGSILLCPAREKISEALSILTSRHIEPLREMSYTSLVSSPSSLMVAPFAVHFTIFCVPCIAAISYSKEGDDLLTLLIFAFVLGISALVLLACGSLLEAFKPGATILLRASFAANITCASAALAFWGIVLHRIVFTQSHSLEAWKVLVMGAALVLEVFVFFTAYVFVAAGSHSLVGLLWSRLTGRGVSLLYVASDDSKAAAEAATSSVAVGLLSSCIIIPLDVAALALCSRLEGVCSTRVSLTAAFAAGSPAAWCLAMLVFLLLTRMRCPPHLGSRWLMDIFARGSLLGQFILSVLLFVFSCDEDHPKGAVRGLMISSGVFRLVSFLLAALLDAATWEERHNAYTNALGTSMLERMRHQADLEEAAETAASRAEADYGTVGEFDATPVGKLRSELRRNRVAWEDGHEAFAFDRDRVFSQAAASFLGLLPRERFRRIFRYEFQREPGLDSGGVAREFFSLLAEHLVSEGLFVPSAGLDCEPSYMIPPHPDPASCTSLEMYRFTGLLLAKALADGHLFSLRLAPPLYRFLLGHRPGGDEELESDLACFDAVLLRQLRGLREKPEEAGDLGLDFTAAYDLGPGKGIISVPLDAGQDSPPKDVTESNAHEYVSLRIRRRVIIDVAPQMDALARGWNEVLLPTSPLGEAVRSLGHVELGKLLSGEISVDVNDWKAHTKYAGSLKNGHRVVKWWWAWVNGLSEADKQRLLLFTTGSRGVPLGGFAVLQGNDGHIRHFTLQEVPRGDEDDPPLPRAHTCFNRLDLPLYRSAEELSEVMTSVLSVDLALTGFGME